MKEIADDTLGQFERIATEAQSKLRSVSSLGPGAFAAMNTLTSPAALNRVSQINQDNRETARTLANEPAIARVTFVDRRENATRYFFCRADQGMADLGVVSYRAPLGRLASLAVGDKFSLPNGTRVKIVESTKLRPVQLGVGWDSRNSVIRTEHFGPLTVASLRAFVELRRDAGKVEDLVEQLLATQREAENVTEGIRRSVLTRMQLRDEATLDKYQDEIFRLPLDKRLLILGPPGTGKTTTLIRRLGQKLDMNALSAEEKAMVDDLVAATGIEHRSSWVMFTPTELLKQYLKEAFALEGVPASDLQIRTWFDFRRDLARNTFGILRTATGGGPFILRESLSIVAPDAIERSIDWFMDFDEWQRTAFITELRTAAQELSSQPESDIASVGRRLVNALRYADGDAIPATMETLVTEMEGVKQLLGRLRTQTDRHIRDALNLQLNLDRKFLEELAEFLKRLQHSSEADDVDDDERDGEDTEVASTSSDAALAVNAYVQAVRTYARAVVSKRALGKNTQSAKIIEWLDDRGLKEGDYGLLGTSLIVQANARQFTNPVGRYVAGVSRRYRTFRRTRQAEGKWYLEPVFSQTDLHPLEVDIVLLAALRGARELLSRPVVIRDVNTVAWTPLRPALNLMRTQVTVDEATDFSPVQMACMAAMTHPKTGSFFACGDFNQRLTMWGSRSTDQFEWIFPNIEIKEIKISYRQSRQLNDLSRSISLAVNGVDPGVSLPEGAHNEGLAPALIEMTPNVSSTAEWLAARIREIERLTHQLPSIALFVEAESKVQPIADALNLALAADNVHVVACPNGQVMGQEGDVRVFDVQHIKGLEFEAVFFISIDDLAARYPQLFDKFLYVGATRAATYLGITCEKELPTAVASLRQMFVRGWGG